MLWATHDVKVELRYVPVQEYLGGSKLQTAFAAGQGPDIFLISHQDFFLYYNGGVLLDLTPYMEDAAKKDFFPSVMGARIVDEKIYGVPFDVEPMAMYYRGGHAHLLLQTRTRAPQRGSGRPIPPLVSKIQAATTNAGARAQCGLTPTFWRSLNWGVHNAPERFNSASSTRLEDKLCNACGLAIIACYYCHLFGYSLYDNQTLSPGSG